jgi:hypothetical protein
VNKNNGKNEPKQKQKQKSTEKPSIDSIDSLICGWGTGRLRRRLETMETTETMEIIDNANTVDAERREEAATKLNQKA